MFADDYVVLAVNVAYSIKAAESISYNRTEFKTLAYKRTQVTFSMQNKICSPTAIKTIKQQ